MQLLLYAVFGYLTIALWYVFPGISFSDIKSGTTEGFAVWMFITELTFLSGNMFKVHANWKFLSESVLKNVDYQLILCSAVISETCYVLLMCHQTHCQLCNTYLFVENAVVTLFKIKTCTQTAIMLQLMTAHKILWRYNFVPAYSLCSSPSISTQRLQWVTGGAFGLSDVTCLSVCILWTLHYANERPVQEFWLLESERGRRVAAIYTGNVLALLWYRGLCNCSV